MWTVGSAIWTFFNTVVLILAVAGCAATLRLLLDFQSYRANSPQKWTALVFWAYAVLIAAGVTIWIMLGYRGPRLLDDGSWRDLAIYHWAFLVPAVLMACVTLGLWVRRSTKDDPRALVSRVPRVLPLHPDLLKPKDGQMGLSDILATLPGNKVFDIQIVEEQVRLHRLPAEWDGLSILHISDLHLAYTPNRPFFEKVMEYAIDLKPDLVALTGDIVDKDARLRWIPNILKRIKAPLGKYYLLGDHDYTIGADKVRDVMEMAGWIDIGERSIIAPIRGKKLLLVGTQRPWVEKHTRAPMGTTVDFSIAMSHYPHHLEWASNRQFDLLLAGHPTGGAINLPWPGIVGSTAMSQGLQYHAPTLMNASHGMGRSWSTAVFGSPAITRLVLHGPNPADRPPAPMTFDAPAQDVKIDPRDLDEIIRDQTRKQEEADRKRQGLTRRDAHHREELSLDDDQEE